jgi:hypothetical protein
MVASPVRDHVGVFAGQVVDSLKRYTAGLETQESHLRRCRLFAEDRTWAKSIGQLDAYLREHA